MTMSKTARIEAVYPLTPMQEGMLFHTLEAPGSGAYVEGWGWDEDLHDERSFEHRVQSVVDVRHAAAAEPAQDAIAPAGRLANEGDLGIRRFVRNLPQLREVALAPEAVDRAGAVPGSAVGAEHLSWELGDGRWEISLQSENAELSGKRRAHSDAQRLPSPIPRLPSPVYPLRSSLTKSYAGHGPVCSNFRSGNRRCSSFSSAMNWLQCSRSTRKAASAPCSERRPGTSTGT